MPILKYQEHTVSTREGENVLDALLRHGISIPFSCRSGVCHVCLHRSIQGDIPAAAQRGLRPEQREQGYFLPCRCVPETDMVIAPPDDAASEGALNELRQVRRAGSAPETAVSADYPPTDAELWAALGNGELLMAVLQDFYERVFQDERLSSFFHGVTKQRSIEKQYMFMRQILTGEKIYFGERPRNAHHWMVISDELFDYRSDLMQSCLRQHGLAEPMAQRFRNAEEFYRRDIVKSAAIPRRMGDVELPLEGFDELVMDVGTLCDSCEREVAAGEKVIYHVRLGKIYCSDCSAQTGQPGQQPHVAEVAGSL